MIIGSKAVPLLARLSPAEARVALLLVCYANRDGMLFPSMRTVALALGLTEDAVQRLIRRLIRRGVLETGTLRTGSGRVVRALRFLDGLAENADDLSGSDDSSVPASFTPDDSSAENGRIIRLEGTRKVHTQRARAREGQNGHTHTHLETTVDDLLAEVCPDGLGVQIAVAWGERAILVPAIHIPGFAAWLQSLQPPSDAVPVTVETPGGAPDIVAIVDRAGATLMHADPEFDTGEASVSWPAIGLLAEWLRGVVAKESRGRIATGIGILRVPGIRAKLFDGTAEIEQLDPHGEPTGAVVGVHVDILKSLCHQERQ